jgi:multimeric flavodoxin WrbA
MKILGIVVSYRCQCNREIPIKEVLIAVEEQGME